MLMKVLLLEDHDVLRGFLAKEIHAQSDVEVCQAATVEQALHLLSSDHFAVVLSDVNVGGNNVAEQIQQFRAQTNGKTRIILTSAGARQTLVNRALQNGADEYVDKSEGLSALVSRVHKAIQNHA